MLPALNECPLFPSEVSGCLQLGPWSSCTVYEQLFKWGVVFPEPKESKAFVMERAA